GLHQRARITLGFFLPQSTDPLADFLAHLEAVARGHLLQLVAALGTIVCQLGESSLETCPLGALLFHEQAFHAVDRQGLACCQQGTFKYPLELLYFHHDARAWIWMGPKGSFCTRSTSDSLISSITARKVTTTPRRPSSFISRDNSGV